MITHGGDDKCVSDHEEKQQSGGVASNQHKWSKGRERLFGLLERVLSDIVVPKLEESF